MIAVKLQGRLGNQLFQYAFAYAAAKKLGVSFYLDQSIDSQLIDKYFNIDSDAFKTLNHTVFRIKGFKNFFTFYFRKFFFKLLGNMLFLKDVAFSTEDSPEKELLKIKDHSLNNGFFQSESYFEASRSAIISEFTIKSNYQNDFLKISHFLPKNVPLVVIHVRRTDYIDINLTLPISYYKKAIRLTEPNSYYIFISDDPQFVEAEFADINQKYISKNPEIIDFQLLMNADICILSNSSFSWWGTYLNTKKTMAIAPKYWSGFNDKVEEPNSIILKNWKLLEI